MDFNVTASAVVVFVRFHRIDEYPNSVKTAETTHNNKYCSGDNGKDFLEYPDERAETDKQ
jgi:hypothetical protein